MTDKTNYKIRIINRNNKQYITLFDGSNLVKVVEIYSDDFIKGYDTPKGTFKTLNEVAKHLQEEYESDCKLLNLVSDKSTKFEAEIEEKPITRVELNNGTGYVEYFDFSKANMSKEERVKAVTKVASICYGNNVDKPQFKLYDMLESESLGLPSSSFEFVPVLLGSYRLMKIKNLARQYQKDTGSYYSLRVVKYGEYLRIHNRDYLITNLRALLEDYENLKDLSVEDFREWYNSDEGEIDMIRNNFFVFNMKITIRATRQVIRHRVNWQELSRRYTSEKKEPLEFYYEDKVEELLDVNTYKDNLMRAYNLLIGGGVPKEEARDVLPGSLYTKLWGGFQKSQMEHFIKLRSKKKTQKQTRDLAIAMGKILKSQKLLKES